MSFWVCSLVAAALLVASAQFLLTARRVDKEIGQGQAVTTLLDADFSKAREFEVSFEDSYRFHHFVRFCIVHSSLDAEASSELHDLKGTLEILSGPQGGAEPIELSDGLSAHSVDVGDGLATFPGERGSYRLKFVISQGAESLRGVPHQLCIANLSCGCERLVPVGSYAMSGLLLLGTLAFGIVAFALSGPQIVRSPTEM